MSRTPAFHRRVAAIKTGTTAALSRRPISPSSAAGAARGVLVERVGDAAPCEGGAAGERAGLARAGSEQDERLQELGARGDAEHGVLAPVEVVGERDRLTGLMDEVVAHVRDAVS